MKNITLNRNQVIRTLFLTPKEARTIKRQKYTIAEVVERHKILNKR